MSNIPDYKDIPQVPGMPHGCTWGMWDKDGEKDQYGCLNVLTPEVVKEAQKEISLGISVSVNWSLDNCSHFHSGRKKPEHRIYQLDDYVAFDDELHINTQTGSQWDGFRHWSHQPTQLFYNGVKLNEIIEGTKPLMNGIDKWHGRGGIVGRGVLIDYLGWAESQGIKYSPVEQHAVTVENLEKAAAAQNVTFKHGDILFVRSGFVKWYNESSDEERTRGMHRSQFTGIEGSQKTIEWVWNHHFAAVAGDASAFEVWPAPVPEFRLHDNLIALMGIPLGEMFDLETLTETCRKLNRWSFFVTSAPLNVKGGIASPPNALCIF